jgi:hypothetical protein
MASTISGGEPDDATDDREIVISLALDQVRADASSRVTHLTYIVGRR